MENIIKPKTVFCTPDGKEFSDRQTAIQHLENETQIYIDQCFIKALSGTNLDINYHARVKIIEHIAGNIDNIKKFIDGFSNILGTEKICFYNHEEDQDYAE